MTSKLSPRLLLFSGFTLLAVSGLALYILLLGGDSAPPGARLQSYQFSASISVQQEVAPLGGPPPADRVNGWYQNPDRWRWEFTYADPVLAESGALLVSDGKSFWSYDGATNTYITDEIPVELRQNPAVFPSLSILLGPIPANSISDYFDQWSGASWETVRKDTLLGRSVDVVQVTIEQAGVTTFWIDPEYLFVLRYEIQTQPEVGLSVDATVTDLEYNGAIDAARFHFEAPRDALQLEPPDPDIQSSSSGSLGEDAKGGILVPAGFLSPTYLPEGLATIGSSASTDSSGITTSVELHFGLGGPNADPVLIIDEQYRAGGLADSLRQGEPVAIGDYEGFLLSEGEDSRLVWAVGDITLTITADNLLPEELIRIAQAMQ